MGQVAAQPAENDWIAHNGGPCPVPADTLVHVRYEDGADDAHADPSTAGWWAEEDAEGCSWRARDGHCGIVAYRVVSA